MRAAMKKCIVWGLHRIDLVGLYKNKGCRQIPAALYYVHSQLSWYFSDLVWVQCVENGRTFVGVVPNHISIYDEWFAV